MRIKEGFIRRTIGGEELVATVGEASKVFHGIIRLNPTSAFLWKELEQGRTREELVQALLNKYETDLENAEKGMEKFLAALQEAGCLIDD